ncbi:MAG: NUDIX domain-containing protein [bacterium]
MIQLITIKAIIQDHQGKILLVRGGDNLWEMPGGRVEIGDGVEKTLRRELGEELGIHDVEIGDIVGVSDSLMALHNSQLFIIAYSCKINPTIELKLSDEHSELGWFSQSEIEKLDIMPAKRYLLDEYFRKLKG